MKDFFKMPKGQEPWSHQVAAVEESRDKVGFGFFFEVGAGKTLAAITALRYKFYVEKRLMRTLILAPPIVLENWKKELLRHSKATKDDLVILHGPGKKRIEKIKSLGDRPKIVITNYESLTMGGKKDKAKRFQRGELLEAITEWHPEVMILDEAHRCKNIKANRTKAAISLADKAFYKFLLTGTPVLNSLEDFFAQFRIMDGGETFGRNYFVFRGRYFRDKNAGMSKQSYFPDWVPREGASEDIRSLVRRKSMHVTKADCLDLPPLVKQIIEVGMSPKQAKAYNSMHKELVAYIDDKAAVAEFAMTKALRLQQIVSGFVNVEEGQGERSAVPFKDHPRKKALKELLSDIAPSHKVLIWAVFKENYVEIREVCDSLKLPFVEVHGGITQKNKMAAVDSLNNDPACRVLIGHPGSGGIGINLVSASHSIFYSRSFSLEYDIQAEARNYRGGSECHDKVTRIDLVTPGTIDEQVLKALASKKDIGYQVLREIL